ncbi:MAG: class I SAM-dependent DNA methyltransferase [Bryobacteraceae bacterium]
MPNEPCSSYDEIAGMYHALWVDWYLPAARPALEKLFFSQVAAGAAVLDVCCGSGHVTKELVKRGYQVTGIDSSAALIAEARKDLLQVDLHVQDARALQLPMRYDAALSTFDSLNHIMFINELRQVFEGVHRALVSNGLFVFDMNVERAYLHEQRRWTVNITDESVGLVRGTYSPQEKKASTEIIWFVKAGENNVWKQHRSVVEQRCYTRAEIVAALSDANFREVEAISAEDLEVTADLGFGRIFFAARA